MHDHPVGVGSLPLNHYLANTVPCQGLCEWDRDLPSKHGAQHCTWPPPCSVPFRGRFPPLSRHITRPWRYMDEMWQAQLGWGFKESAVPADTKPNPVGKRRCWAPEVGLPSLENQQREYFNSPTRHEHFVLVAMRLVGALRAMTHPDHATEFAVRRC